MARRSRQSEAAAEGGEGVDGAPASKPPTEGKRLDTGNISEDKNMDSKKDAESSHCYRALRFLGYCAVLFLILSPLILVVLVFMWIGEVLS